MPISASLLNPGAWHCLSKLHADVSSLPRSINNTSYATLSVLLYLFQGVFREANVRGLKNSELKHHGALAGRRKFGTFKGSLVMSRGGGDVVSRARFSFSAANATYGHTTVSAA